MAYRSWSTPSALLSGGRGGYSFGGPGNRSASIAALQAISNPRDVANITSQPLPVADAALQEQQYTPIAEAMRGPATRRAAAPVRGGQPADLLHPEARQYKLQQDILDSRPQPSYDYFQNRDDPLGLMDWGY